MHPFLSLKKFGLLCIIFFFAFSFFNEKGEAFPLYRVSPNIPITKSTLRPLANTRAERCKIVEIQIRDIGGYDLLASIESIFVGKEV